MLLTEGYGTERVIESFGCIRRQLLVSLICARSRETLAWILEYGVLDAATFSAFSCDFVLSADGEEPAVKYGPIELILIDIFMIVSGTWILDTGHEHGSNVSAAVHLTVEPERLHNGGLGRRQVISLHTRRFQQLSIEEVLGDLGPVADRSSFGPILLVDCMR